MTSPREWQALFDRIDGEDEYMETLKAERDQLRAEIARIKECVVDQASLDLAIQERDEARALMEHNPLVQFLEAAEKRGFVIQLIPGRLYKVPKEA